MTGEKHMSNGKAAFVSDYLAPALINADRSGIVEARYENNGSAECVIVVMKSGRERRINVTADSETAILYDVIRELHDSEWM